MLVFGSCSYTTSWPSRGPLQVLSHEAVARLELVEPCSELLVRLSHGRVRLLLVARPVFSVACSSELCLDPLAGVCPLSLGALAFDVGEGAGWCALPSIAVHVSVLFYAGASGSSAACLAHSSAFRCLRPRSGWAIIVFRSGSLAPCGGVRLAAMGYRYPRPGPSEAILYMVA